MEETPQREVQTPRAGTVPGRGGTPFEPFRAVGFLLSSLGHAVSAELSSITAQFGLQPREFAILHRISQTNGLSQQALSERLNVPPSRMVAAIDSLQSRKLVERRTRQRDRRVRELHLTKQGQSVLWRATLAAARFERQLTVELSPAQREQLFQLLSVVGRPLELRPGVDAAAKGLAATPPRRAPADARRPYA